MLLSANHCKGNRAVQASNEDGEVAIERIVSMDGVYIANYVDDPLVAFSEEEGELVGDEPVVGHSGAAAIWRTPFQEGIEFQGHHGSVKPSRDEDYISMLCFVVVVHQVCQGQSSASTTGACGLISTLHKTIMKGVQ